MLEEQFPVPLSILCCNFQLTELLKLNSSRAIFSLGFTLELPLHNCIHHVCIIVNQVLPVHIVSDADLMKLYGLFVEAVNAGPDQH